jgi:hypothetical protein
MTKMVDDNKKIAVEQPRLALMGSSPGMTESEERVRAIYCNLSIISL